MDENEVLEILKKRHESAGDAQELAAVRSRLEGIEDKVESLHSTLQAHVTERLESAEASLNKLERAVAEIKVKVFGGEIISLDRESGGLFRFSVNLSKKAAAGVVGFVALGVGVIANEGSIVAEILKRLATVLAGSP